MKIEITVELENNAFEEDTQAELRRILATVRVEHGQNLYDVNGNVVGNTVLKF